MTHADEPRLDAWLDELRGERGAEALYSCAAEFAAIIRATPPTEYRRMAECKLTDAISLALVALRQ